MSHILSRMNLLTSFSLGALRQFWVVVHALMPSAISSVSSPVVYDFHGRDYNVSMVVTDEIRLLIPTMDNYLGRYARTAGTYDLTEKAFIESLISEGMAIVEIGTNFGPYSVYIARKIGPNGLLYCFEPFRVHYQLLTANIAINGLRNVITENLGLADSPSRTVEANAPDPRFEDNYGAACLLSDDRKTWLFPKFLKENITIIPLDSYSIDRHIDLIKIDAEGMEFEVILGASNMLTLHSPVVYVENDPNTTFLGQSFERMMRAKFDYSCTRPSVLVPHNIVLCQPS